MSSEWYRGKALNELISVIMGVYNAEDTISDAIHSIINQTYSNWELIICDDGSTDASHSIAESFDDPRILVISNEKNMGLGYALNRCIEKAKGPFIARMDADDLSMPHRLEKELEVMKSNPQYGVVSCKIIMFDDVGEYLTATSDIDHFVPRPEDFIIGSPIAHPACMMRKELLDSIGGYNEGRETLRVEDVDLWIRLLKKGCQFCVLQEPLYKWRFDYDTIRRQRMVYRWNAATVIYKGCKSLRLPSKYYLLSLRPIFVGLIPAPIRYMIHKKRMRR